MDTEQKNQLRHNVFKVLFRGFESHYPPHKKTRKKVDFFRGFTCLCEFFKLFGQITNESFFLNENNFSIFLYVFLPNWTWDWTRDSCHSLRKKSVNSLDLSAMSFLARWVYMSCITLLSSQPPISIAIFSGIPRW